MFHRLSDNFYVAGQITRDHLAQAKKNGVVVIVNNRPDGEDPTAPQAAAIAMSAAAIGLDYRSIPITHAGFSAPQLDALEATMEIAQRAGGSVLAYCKSGMRSTALWALVQARCGGDITEICDTAKAVGYDLTSLRGSLDALVGSAPVGSAFVPLSAKNGD